MTRRESAPPAAGDRARCARPLARGELEGDVLVVARRLLGCTVEADTPQGPVVVRLVEVEAYRGADDPGSHCYRGRTARNAVMWGPAGHLYVYFVYGMHFCANVVAQGEGVAGAVLLRAGEVISDPGVAHARRPTARGLDRELARGPARLCALLGVGRDDNGTDVLSPSSRIHLEPEAPVDEADVRCGPRVGVAAGQERPWRFWIAGSGAVTPYKAGRARPEGPDW